MFNVLQGVECTEGRHSLRLERIYCEKPYKSLTELDFEKFARRPTILMEEGAPHSDNKIEFAKLSEFSIVGKEVTFDLRFDLNRIHFPASLLDQYKSRHKLSDQFNWHHTCWQFGEGNIFETLYRDSLTSRISNRPKVFNLPVPAKINEKQIACMMPFSPSFDDVYVSISKASADAGFATLRVDEVYKPQAIIQDVVDAINTARIVVCDLTGKNANVLYETGIAHSLGRDVIMITQSMDDVPFDLRHLRCVHYSATNHHGREELERKLTKMIEGVLSGA